MKRGIVLALLTVFLLLPLTALFSEGQVEEAEEPAWQKIDWNKPVPMVERITGQGPVVDIPTKYNGFGVDFAGKKGMLTGYQLPEGWEEATKGVTKIVMTNSGGLAHDPATLLEAELFKEWTGIEVEVIEMKDELLWPKALATLAARAPDVDIFYCSGGPMQISHLVAGGWSIPTDHLWPQEVVDLYPDFISWIQKDGTFWGGVYMFSDLMLFYRPSWLQGAGVDVPETWQDLITASKKVDTWAKQNIGERASGLVFGIATPMWTAQLWANTTYAKGERLVRNGKVVIDPDAWEVMTDLWLEGGMSLSSLELSWSSSPEVFAKGNAGFAIDQGVYIRMFDDPNYGTAIQGDWDVTLGPGWEGKGNRGAEMVQQAWLSINPYISSEQQAAAMLWIDWLRSYQAQFNQLYVEGNDAFFTAVYDHPAVQAEVPRPAFRQDVVNRLVGESYPVAMMEMIDIVKEYLDRVVLGDMSADEALEAVQSEIDSLQ